MKEKLSTKYATEMLNVCWEELTTDSFPPSIHLYIKKLTKITTFQLNEAHRYICLLKRFEANTPLFLDGIIQDIRYLHIIMVTIQDELRSFKLQPLWYIKVSQLVLLLEKEIKNTSGYQQSLRVEFRMIFKTFTWTKSNN